VIAPPPTVVDVAYERLRALVLSGDIAPGARLGQVDLAKRFGISRTPIREALRRLSGEGLVDFHANRGFRVADLGLDAVLLRLEVRAIVEPGIARLAAERRTPQDAIHALIVSPRGPSPAPPYCAVAVSASAASTADPARGAAASSRTRSSSACASRGV
jgi:DNA-binding transcriptional regulator YhcF (GntR family)